jgi:hypothetical protein
VYHAIGGRPNAAPDLARSIAFAREARHGPVSARPSGYRVAVLGLLVLASAAIAGFSAVRVHAHSRAASLVAAADVPAARIQEVDVMRMTTSMALATALASSALAGDNLISGGDFESVPQGGQGAACHSTILSSVPGWQAAGGWQVDRFLNDESCPSGAFRPYNKLGGGRFISLQGSVCCGCNNNGWIQQTVPTTAGGSYVLEFDVALDFQDVLSISVGQQVTTLDVDESTEWERHSIYFTATGATMIRFESVGSTGWTSTPDGGCWEGEGCLLDNIVVREVSCPGDVIQNGIIDGADLSALLSVWGTDGGIYPRADTNGDGEVNGADLSAVLSGWGACP